MGQFSRTDYQTPSVADESALSDIWVAECEDGTSVWVQDQGAYYTLSHSSGAAVGSGVVAPRAGAPIAGFPSARWLRQSTSNANFAQQTAWYINPATGDNSNSGLTALTAIQTWAEFSRRLNGQYINQVTNVYLLSDSPANDPLFLQCTIGTLGVLTFHGTPTSLGTGTITGEVNLSAATQQPTQTVDAAIPVSWTASGYIGKRIRLTSGAQVGALAWVAKDLGARTARTSAWEVYDTTTLPYTVSPSNAVNAPVASAYIIEQLTAIGGLVDVRFDVPSTFDPTYGDLRVMFEGLSLIGDKMTVLSTGALLGVQFTGCDVGAATVLAGGVVRFTSCSFIATEIPAGGTLDYVGGIMGEFSFTVHAGGECAMRDVLSQGGNVIVQGQLDVFGTHGLGIWDVAAGNALQISPSGVVTGNIIWGSNNAARGIGVNSGGKVVYDVKPTVTGAGGDTTVGGANLAYAGIPAITAANNAMIVVNA